MGGKKDCPRKKAGIVSHILFSWFDSLARKGFRKPLKPHVWELEEENESSQVVHKFEAAWGCESDRKLGDPVSILPVLFKAFGVYFAVGSVMTGIPHLLDLLAPFILR